MTNPKLVGQEDGTRQDGRNKENQGPPVLLAGLISSTASKAKKSEKTLADTILEMEVISQCELGWLQGNKPSRTNMAKIKLEGNLDVVEYSRNSGPESVHMSDPAGGYMEMVKARSSARGLLRSWYDKQAMQEHLKELVTGSNKKRKEYGTVMSSEANEKGLELLKDFLEGSPTDVFRRNHAYSLISNGVHGQLLWHD